MRDAHELLDSLPGHRDEGATNLRAVAKVALSSGPKAVGRSLGERQATD